MKDMQHFIMTVLLILCVLWIAAPIPSLNLIHRCPPQNISVDCVCAETEIVAITCKRITNSFIYQEAIRQIKGYAIDKFVIENNARVITNNNSNLHLIPGIFNKLYINEVVFENMNFGSLPMLTFLNGLEESLMSISFIRCKVSSWIWKKGSHFSFLKNVNFHGTSLPSNLTKSILAVFPQKIQTLKMSRCKIEALGENALRRFGLLEKLELQENGLITIKRSALPLPANRFTLINLNKNSLESLPDDVFIQMKWLEYLYLSFTKLKYLKQKTFEPIWKQLKQVDFNDTSLTCNCDTAWLLNITANTGYNAPSCDMPRNETKLLTSFSYGELCP